MFRYFKRRKDKPSVMYPTIQQLSGFIREKQQKAADWLQRQTMHYSRRTLSVLLVIFCLLFGGSSVCIIIGVLGGDGKAITVQQISFPAHAIDTCDGSFKQVPILTDKAYQNIQRFKHYMDSLNKNHPLTFDSIIKTRPGLIDSLLLIESIYQEQLKIK